jgi:hypothetical protein
MTEPNGYKGKSPSGLLGFLRFYICFGRSIGYRSQRFILIARALTASVEVRPTLFFYAAGRDLLLSTRDAVLSMA